MCICGSSSKNLPDNVGVWVWSLGREDALEEEVASHSSILAWRIPWTEEPGRLQSIELHRVGHNCNDLAHTQWKALAESMKQR